MKKIVLASALALISVNSYASTYVMCHFNSFTSSHSSSPINVTSTHDVVITNTSNTTKPYHVEYRTFINKKLIHIEKIDVNVDSGGTFQESKMTSSLQTFSSKTNLDASCETLVTGSEKADIKGGGSINIT